MQKAIPLSLSLMMSVLNAADSNEENLSLAALLDVKLTTGSFLELDLMNSPVSMSVITKNQVKHSGARHMSELLEVYVPGFQYMHNKWNGEIWGMRGVASSRNTKVVGNPRQFYSDFKLTCDC